MRSSSLLLVIALVAAPALAAAQAPAKKSPTAADLANAKTHFKNAEVAKAKGDYKTAAVEYLAAYQLFEEPEFFFDVAEVDKLAGDSEDALTYYEKYLELEPNGRGAATARSSADELRRTIAAKQDAAQKAAAQQKAADDAAAKKAADAAAKKAAEDQAKLPPPPGSGDGTPPPPSSSGDAGKGLRIAGIASGGVGVIAIGAGVLFGLRAKSISDEVSNAATFDQARYDQGKAANRDMFIFTGVGAAALIAGGVMYYLGHQAGAEPADHDTAVTFAPSITPDTITFTAAGRF